MVIGRASMMKIETVSEGQNRILRLIGRIQSDHLHELKAQMALHGPATALDLNEVTLVDVDVVRFLRAAEREGVQLRHCPPFIREWISREDDEEKKW
jgi:anti-anti-sigma regulatory factor